MLIGFGAAVLYGLLSRRACGDWNVALSVEVGVVVAVVFWGLRFRASGDGRGDGEGRGKAETAGGGRQRNASSYAAGVSRPQCDAESVDAAVSPRQNEAGTSILTRQVAASTEEHVLSPTPTQNSNSSSSSDAPPAESPEAIWERARLMVHDVVPNFEKDAEYLDLVFTAAERGHVPALAKLGDYAFRRGALVEAYFWTKIARRRLELQGAQDPRGLKEIDNKLLIIRRQWAVAEQPPEYENVYDSFPAERSRIGRAFLRIDSGILVSQMRSLLRELAKKGNPDAALFA